MDLIDRYLNAVAAQLPQDERDDIIAELRDLILSRFEAKEEALGRALTDDEKEAILHEIGHPLVVAARYRKGPDSLIGPELFPYWLFAVKAGLLLMAAVQAIVLFINLVSGPADAGQSIGQAINGFINSGLTLVGVVTLIGAVMEHMGYRPGWMSKWKVNELSAFGLSDPAAWGAAMAGTCTAKATWAPRSLGRAKGWPGGEYLFSFLATGVFELHQERPSDGGPVDAAGGLPADYAWPRLRGPARLAAHHEGATGGGAAGGPAGGLMAAMSENRETRAATAPILRPWKTPANWIRRPATAPC
jgi:hypothetical protein